MGRTISVCCDRANAREGDPGAVVERGEPNRNTTRQLTYEPENIAIINYPKPLYTGRIIHERSGIALDIHDSITVVRRSSRSRSRTHT